jgi:hypothetical protein
MFGYTSTNHPRLRSGSRSGSMSSSDVDERPGTKPTTTQDAQDTQSKAFTDLVNGDDHSEAEESMEKKVARIKARVSELTSDFSSTSLTRLRT